MEILLRQLLIRRLIPDTPAIGADLHAFGPAAACAAAVGPASHVNGARVNDDGFIAGGDDGRGDGHGLDREARRVGRIVFAELGAEVEVFFALDGSGRRVRDNVDVREPFHRAGEGRQC